MREVKRIESEVQLLVEGNDQRNFFEALVEHLALDHIQIQDFGGIDELRGFLLAFVDAPGFRGNVRSIGIVRDAETSASSAFDSIRSSLGNAGLPVPDSPETSAAGAPTVTVLMLPGDNRKGMLETLLCETFSGTPVDTCIDAFFECFGALSESPVRRLDKARARSYLVTKPEPHLSVGVAAKRGYWDLNHDVFDNVRRFLETL